MKIKQTFEKAGMNLDADERFVAKGEYRQAQNFKVLNSDSGDQGSGTKPNGTQLLSNLSIGSNPVSLGIEADQYLERIYWAVVSDTGSFLIEYERKTDTASFLLQDTRTPNILNFHEDHRVKIDVLVDTDNSTTFLFFTDNYNPPRCINTSTAKGYGLNGFTEDDINVIVAPPLSPPTINLVQTNSAENNLDEKFLVFATRYKYPDNQYSVISPFSQVAFLPKAFSYDYGTSTNESMVNNYNAVDITFNTGSSLVTDVELLFKESGSEDIYVVETFNKDDNTWGDDEDQVYTFVNNKVYRKLPEKQFRRLYDNVPLLAKTQSIINNRIVYGYYTENYDLIDLNGNTVIPNYTLLGVHDAVTTPVLSLKTSRDYEIGIVYMDDYGRSTTVLTSKENTIYFKNFYCDKQNKIKVFISNLAPAFATKYRMYIKQPRPNYDVIVPTLFYQDGAYVWIKLEGNDIDKINQGDILNVKADTQGILDEAVKVKVLEVKTQDRNFLDPTITASTEQLAGTYFKVKTDNFRMQEADFTNYIWNSYASGSNDHDNPIRGTSYDEIADPIFYGVGLDDIASSGSHTGTDGDHRYKVEIDAEGTPDTFTWYKDDVEQATGVAITGSAQTLDAGVQITFTSTTGHTDGDYWNISVYDNTADIGVDENAYPYALYQSLEGDTIEAGARIRFIYDEYGTFQEYVEDVFISSARYENIEEWFYEDNIGDQLGIPDSRIWFRRGTIGEDDGSKYLTMDNSKTGDDYQHQMTMVIKSRYQDNPFTTVKIESTLEIFQSEQNLLLETYPNETNLEVFYEIGKTYDIDQVTGRHQGDVNQGASTSAQITLDVGNCFVWGNGFESKKIRDGLTEPAYDFDTKPLLATADYGKKIRIASLTYSDVFDQTSNYNGLNEFNLSQANYKDLDDKYGSIQRLFSRNTNLLVLQEDKTLEVLVDKDILYNADGSENVRQSTRFLNSVRAFSYEGGISSDPWTFAVEGNNIWHTDTNRGNVMRLGADGYTKISNYGMRDYFRDILKTNRDAIKIATYDPFNDQYVLHIKEAPPATVLEVGCGYNVIKYAQTAAFSYNFRLNEYAGDVSIDFTTDDSIDIAVVFNSVDYGGTYASGTHNITFTRDSLVEDIVAITVTPNNANASYSIINNCPVGLNTRWTQIVINDNTDDALTMKHFYIVNNSGVRQSTRYDRFIGSGVTRFQVKLDKEQLTHVPKNGDTIRMYIENDTLTTGDFNSTVGNRIGYLVSTTVYTSADVNTILPLATFPAITSANVGEVNQTHYIEFTYNKPTENSHLYLIWDYRDYTISAVNDTYTVVKGTSRNLQVLGNDSLSGDFFISAVSTPTNGTATISADGTYIIYTHDNSVTTSDSFTYTVENEEFVRAGAAGAQDTATVNLNITANLKGEGGGGGTSVDFAISSTSASDPQNICLVGTTSSNKYHDGELPNPEVGDKVYNDNGLTSPFNGGNQWWLLDNSTAVYIATDGRVEYSQVCIPNA